MKLEWLILFGWRRESDHIIPVYQKRKVAWNAPGDFSFLVAIQVEKLFILSTAKRIVDAEKEGITIEIQPKVRISNTDIRVVGIF
jgi:hypothetical protein